MKTLLVVLLTSVSTIGSALEPLKITVMQISEAVEDQNRIALDRRAEAAVTADLWKVIKATPHHDVVSMLSPVLMPMSEVVADELARLQKLGAQKKDAPAAPKFYLCSGKGTTTLSDSGQGQAGQFFAYALYDCKETEAPAKD